MLLEAQESVPAKGSNGHNFTPWAKENHNCPVEILPSKSTSLYERALPWKAGS